jgi:hypothetical protein
MADPVTMAVVSVGSNLIGGISQKRAADRAASAANQAAEFNAQLIERDVDLLARQRSIVNAQFAIDDFAHAQRSLRTDCSGHCACKHGLCRLRHVSRHAFGSAAHQRA